MAHGTKVGVIGAGWPGVQHARGYRAAGGFQLLAVADLIPDRRKKLMLELGVTREYTDAKDLLADKEIEAVSICLPNPLHLPIALAALKAKKHVICETPPAVSSREAKQLASAAAKHGKVLTYAFQRRFGGAELAAKQAIDKGYAGEVYHARATWMRTRGIPIGTGWYTQAAQSGGGAMLDLGVQMLDVGWRLLGQPQPVSVFAVKHQKFRDLAPADSTFDVDDSAFALIKFEGGKSLELASSWAINQSPAQNGTVCRVHGDKGAVEVYTPQGPVLYRNFSAKGEAKETPLKTPKVVGHAAMLRHFREAILGKAVATPSPAEGVALMQIIEALYKSAESGKSQAVNMDRVGPVAAADDDQRLAEPALL